MRISRPVSGRFGVVCMGKVDALVAETWENWDWICPNVFMVGGAVHVGHCVLVCGAETEVGGSPLRCRDIPLQRRGMDA